jgi:ribose transport system permease protein
MDRRSSLLPLLVAIVTLELLFRFGVPLVWNGCPNFLDIENQINLLEQVSLNGILALGMTLTILIGGIDLSVGAVVALVGTTTVYLISKHTGETQNMGWTLLASLAGMGVALAIGLFNGICIAMTRMPPFIVTLGTMLIARGAALHFKQGQPVSLPPRETLFDALGNGKLADLLPGFLHGPLEAAHRAALAQTHDWGISAWIFAALQAVPISVLVLAAAFAMMAVLLHRTRFGQHLYAMGGNREAARFTGIPLVRNEIAVYVICSLFAGVVGLINAAQLSSGQPNSGVGFELNAIAAAVVGGTSFTGGIGTIPGVLLGVLIIGILNKGLNQAGVFFSVQEIVKGFVILAAVYVDVRRKKR